MMDPDTCLVLDGEGAAPDLLAAEDQASIPLQPRDLAELPAPSLMEPAAEAEKDKGDDGVGSPVQAEEIKETEAQGEQAKPLAEVSREASGESTESEGEPDGQDTGGELEEPSAEGSDNEEQGGEAEEPASKRRRVKRPSVGVAVPG